MDENMKKCPQTETRSQTSVFTLSMNSRDFYYTMMSSPHNFKLYLVNFSVAQTSLRI